MAVTLKSRIPEITAALPVEVGAAIHRGTEEIAKNAQDRADSLYQSHEEDRPFSIEAGTVDGKYGIKASWFWFFGEFGTVHETSRPFMIPAAEAGKANLVADVRAALEKL